MRAWRAAMLAACAAAIPATAQATLTLSLQLAPGAAGAANTTAYLDPSKAGADIPIYVYATVTGLSAITPVPTGGTSSSPPSTTNGKFDGIQFAYYNVVNTVTTQTTGVIDTSSGHAPTLNALGNSGFASTGAQAGLVQNIPNGISLGSSNTADPSSGVAFARSGSPVFDNYYTFSAATQTYTLYGNDAAGDIYLSNNNHSASFLLETLYFKPSFTAGTFTASTPTSHVATTFSISAVNPPASTGLRDANWFEDLDNEPANGGQPSKTMNDPYSVGTSVSFVDTLIGDTNDDGTVDLADLTNLASNYPTSSGATWSRGDLDHNGTVDLSDLTDLATNYGKNLYGTGSSMSIAQSQAMFNADVAYLESQGVVGVPEPATAALLAAGAVLLGGRSRRGCSKQESP